MWTTFDWWPLVSFKLHDPFRLVIVHLPSQRGCRFLAVDIDNHTGSPFLKERGAV